MERIGAVPGDEEITGVVVFDEYSWVIRNDNEKRAVFLFSETAMDKVIGNIYEDIVLAQRIIGDNS